MKRKLIKPIDLLVIYDKLKLSGMDIVNKIAEVKTNYADRPLEDQKISTMTVETFGVEYPAPEKA